jgi:hypothetical protein
MCGALHGDTVVDVVGVIRCVLGSSIFTTSITHVTTDEEYTQLQPDPEHQPSLPVVSARGPAAIALVIPEKCC